MNLEDSVSTIPFVGPAYAKRLENLGITRVKDLLFHTPKRYIDFRKTVKIARVGIGEAQTVQGEIVFCKNQYTKARRKIQIAELKDPTGSLKLIFFGQPFLVKTLTPGTTVSVAGTAQWFGRDKAFISPLYELFNDTKTQAASTGRLLPVYSETKGISSKWINKRIRQVLEKMTVKDVEVLDEKILAGEKLEGLHDAFYHVHLPESESEIETGKKRIAFDELLYLHLKSLYREKDWLKTKAAFKLDFTDVELSSFMSLLPFELTKAQKLSIDEICTDLKNKKTPMNRLLEGDVGSGKTVVAAAGAFVAHKNAYKSIFMAPTQILAQQHFETLSKIFENSDITVQLITSQGIQGDTKHPDVIVGTHALIHKKAHFTDVAFVVVDEQHRFGVEQRAHLVDKSSKGTQAPHVLTMTATPIPRTIALAAYGDLSLSVIDELPKGRKPITTWIVPENKRNGAYDWIEKQIEEFGIQAYVICPLIEESEAEMMTQVKAATVEFEKLKKLFKKRKVGLLHGKLSADTKNKVLKDFNEKKYDILVSTPVIEVGIDVPNATIMVIEAAERFGLAQLHQLRGRVGRGEKKSYCLLLSTSQKETVQTRLRALTTTHSGFELAELDLSMRGPGEMFGFKQSGFPDLKTAQWTDTPKMVKTKKLAQVMIKNPKKYKKIIDLVKKDEIILN